MSLPIVVINLDSRPMRWNSFLQTHNDTYANDAVLQNMNCTIHRLSATDMPQDPSVGCLTSHIRAIQLAQSKGWEHVIVMEDDARWSMDAGNRLTNVLKDIETVDSKAFVVFLGAGTSKRIGYHSRYLGTLLANGIITSTHAMLYRKVGYESIIETLESALQPDNWCSHIDLLLSTTYAGTNHLYIAVPFVARFADSASNSKSDVRTKSTEQDLLQLQDTEDKLSAAFEALHMKHCIRNEQ